MRCSCSGTVIGRPSSIDLVAGDAARLEELVELQRLGERREALGRGQLHRSFAGGFVALHVREQLFLRREDIFLQREIAVDGRAANDRSEKPLLPTDATS